LDKKYKLLKYWILLNSALYSEVFTASDILWLNPVKEL
jgi:hypothetical protein